jgi:hypothetical protein
MLAFTPIQGENELEKKFNIARASHKKDLQGERVKHTYIAGVNIHLPLI